MPAYSYYAPYDPYLALQYARMNQDSMGSWMQNATQNRGLSLEDAQYYAGLAQAMRIAQMQNQIAQGNLGVSQGGLALNNRQFDWQSGVQFPWEQQTWQKNYDEMIRQYNTTFGEDVRQFDLGYGLNRDIFGETKKNNARNYMLGATGPLVSWSQMQAGMPKKSQVNRAISRVYGRA